MIDDRRLQICHRNMYGRRSWLTYRFLTTRECPTLVFLKAFCGQHGFRCASIQNLVMRRTVKGLAVEISIASKLRINNAAVCKNSVQVAYRLKGIQLISRTIVVKVK